VKTVFLLVNISRLRSFHMKFENLGLFFSNPPASPFIKGGYTEPVVKKEEIPSFIKRGGGDY